jgi:DNA-binding MarR family transcriptional regulator
MTPEVEVRQALAALELAAIRHRRVVRRRLQVGDEELSALLYLAHHGGVLQRDLARVTSLSRSGAGAMLQRLEERGYVMRHTDRADRRLRLVELSAEGHAQMRREYGELDARLDLALAGEPAEHVGALAGLLTGLANAAQPPDDENELSAVGEPADPIWRDWG